MHVLMGNRSFPFYDPLDKASSICYILCIIHNTLSRGTLNAMNKYSRIGKNSTNSPLIKLTIAERVAAALRQEIITGQLAAGIRLRQNEIAQRFEVSSTPVREAFGLLQSEGLVQIDPHRGVTVFSPDIQGLIEHYEIRIALEVLAIEKAAEHFQAQDAPALTAILDEFIATSDAARFVELNHQFHTQLYRLARRPRLLTMIEDFRNASNAYLHLYAAAYLPRAIQHADSEHRAILAACQTNDPARAASTIRHHLQQTVKQVMGMLEKK